MAAVEVNHADGLVLVTDSQPRKFLSFDDPVPGVPGSYFRGVRSISLNDRDEAAFAAVYGPCGDWYHRGQSEGIFTYERNSIRKVVSSGNFETPGKTHLPAGWATAWNSGGGSASRFQCGLEAAFDGSSVLRLKVVPGAGSAFVLSDPFPVLPDQHYPLSSQLRHYLKGAEAAYFSVLEFDSSGNPSSFNETSTHAGENAWNWELESVQIRTAPNTSEFFLDATLPVAEHANGLLPADGWETLEEVVKGRPIGQVLKQ